MINVNMSSNLQGDQGWDQLAGLVKAGETQAAGSASVSIADKQITITITNGTATQSVSISVPDLGPMDSVPDTEALQSIADKIVALANSMAAVGAFNVDGTVGTELQAAIGRLQDSLAQLSQSSSSTDPSMNMTNTSKALFDLYALMALMVEVAQKERDTSREIRLTENQQVQNSIKQQADEMRNAAVISLAFGIVSTVVSGVMSVTTMIGQAKAFAKQTTATNKLNTPTENLKAAQFAAESPAAADAHFKAVAAKTPEAVKQRIEADFGAAKTEFEAKIGPADTALREAKAAQAKAGSELADLQKAVPKDETAIKAKLEEYNVASEQVSAAETNRSSIEHGFYDKLDTRIKANDAAISANEELIASKQAALKKASGDEAAQLKTEIKDLQKQVADAQTENTYLRAYTAKSKSEHASEGLKNADLMRAQNKYDIAKKEVEQGNLYAGSQQMMNRWMGIQQLQMSLTQMANASGNMISEMVRAQATMEGVEQTQHNEQLDQIKDLFQQAETVVQAVVQLMQAVLSAENESIMEAIRA